MKFLACFLLIASMTADAQSYVDSISDKKIDGLLDKIRAGQASADDRNLLQQIALLVQNKAQEMDVHHVAYKKTLPVADKAIVLFDALNDTLNVANNRKFKAYLLGRAGKFPQAKQETATAIHLYQLKKMHAEVAASQFDLSRLFEFDSKTDSAIYYANLSKAFWRQQGVDLRVLIINNMLVNLLLEANQPEKAELIYQESARLAAEPQMQWQALLDFYFTSALLFTKTNDMASAGRFRNLYADKIAGLAQQGIRAKSYYEPGSQ